MSEQEATACAALCNKIADLPPKAQEAIANIAEGMVLMKEITEAEKQASIKQ